MPPFKRNKDATFAKSPPGSPIRLVTAHGLLERSRLLGIVLDNISPRKLDIDELLFNHFTKYSSYLYYL
ncbi:uncharacterized protein RCO7_14804 [Rhynchosporium graminicola]|uniref:Uncharacterized protein n=1 Tax=Rhynchosporium graminicola TaxID=2792576 RepID=A0A1E1L3C1_9HELO|nr:uncharacterized protein RCO7_14804 [Rhynchosporium commune]